MTIPLPANVDLSLVYSEAYRPWPGIGCGGKTQPTQEKPSLAARLGRSWDMSQRRRLGAWVFQILHYPQPEAAKETPTAVRRHQAPYHGRGRVDLYPRALPRPPRTGIATTGLRVASDHDGKGSGGPAIRI